MQDYISHTINRSVIVLLPRMAAYNWIMSIDPAPSNLTLEELRREPDAFLVREDRVELPEQAERWIYRRWEMFFEKFLEDWYTDESTWPQKRSLKMFKEWFEVQYCPLVWDMAKEVPLGHQDWD